MLASRPPPPDLSNPSRATKQGMGLAAQGGRDAAPTAVLPARLPQPPGPPRPAPVPSVRPGARAGRCRARGVRGTRGWPGHLRRVRARERGPGHGAGGRGGGRTARAGGVLGSGSSAGRPLHPLRRAGSGRSRSLPPPPVVRGSDPLPSPFPPAGWGHRGAGPLPSGRERKVRAGPLPVSGSGGSGRGRPAAGRRYLAAPVANFHARTCHTV